MSERFGTAYEGPDVVSGATIRLTCLSVRSIRSNVTELASFRLPSAVFHNKGREHTASIVLVDQSPWTRPLRQ